MPEQRFVKTGRRARYLDRYDIIEVSSCNWREVWTVEFISGDDTESDVVVVGFRGDGHANVCFGGDEMVHFLRPIDSEHNADNPALPPSRIGFPDDD